MVEPGRKVISGIVTGSPPVRSTYKVPYDRIKVMLELGVVTVLLVLASPIMLLCLIAVRLGSKGSPLYSQKRLGSCGLYRPPFDALCFPSCTSFQRPKMRLRRPRLTSAIDCP